MRTELKEALEAFDRGIVHEHWYGKTYRSFWEWFDQQEASILAMTRDEAEAEAVRDAIQEIVVDADDGGYAIPPEMIDRIIERTE